MPKQDGSLTNADRLALSQALDRMIKTGNPDLPASALGIGAKLEEITSADESARSALLRMLDALSLDMTSHVVGGFSAMTEHQQISALFGIEQALPCEFKRVHQLAYDLYYENTRTPQRPSCSGSPDESWREIQ